MKIKKTEFPETSILSPGRKDFDYIDSFKGYFSDRNRNIEISEIGKAFFSSGTKWGSKMFAIRNKLVRLFGLKTGSETGMQTGKDFKCEVGERVGIFEIFAKTGNEIVLGENDKHLDFRVSLLVDKSKENPDENSLTISTTVIYHNWLGLLYFIPVRPFHKLIVPAMLKNMISNLESKKQSFKK